MIAAAVVPTTTWYLVLAAGLFAIGMIGVLVRRNPLIMFMCIELMLNAANLTFLAFARERADDMAHISAFFVIAVAAAEASTLTKTGHTITAGTNYLVADMRFPQRHTNHMWPT